ncbi:hypothetical protein DACRYDRAFT_113457 [Dacryopinax primogenitus]|uniref:Protein kinase domain-containing protein n=1 Tax=Dacryopinax primogenitus (strain DJM 731) TaxID=1858805 RepID=M5G4V6_DACPD|nr:uncharacterized protein DACRYDRAFT_113457 [Dacryopinax primogenitus]EJU05296.1 hypothetical protein DACRYDRAFT_113457 [Dacryopinax primogenitus]
MTQNARLDLFQQEKEKQGFWLERKELAIEHPLSPEITITGVRDEQLDDVCEPASQPGIASPSEPHPLYKPSTCVMLKLIRGLHVGPNCWSQVWLTQRRPLRESEGADCVAKFVQEGLFPKPDSFCEGPEICRATGLYRREAQAYARMESIQGKIIPKSYGFYTFTLPGNQMVQGHVMEYIDGTPLVHDYKSMRDGTWELPVAREERRRSMISLVDAVYAIYALGVNHGDLRPSNVLQLRTDPVRYVIIDFGRASLIDVGRGRIRDQLSYGQREDRMGLWECLCEIEEAEFVLEWMKECMTSEAPLTGLFQKKEFLEYNAPRARGIEYRYRESAKHYAI